MPRLAPEPEMTSHETVCLLNAGERPAHVEITIFYADREPGGPYRVTVPPWSSRTSALERELDALR